MSQCLNCHAGCCRSFAVPVTGADVLRLERETGLGFWEFACRWADPEGRIAGRYAPHLYFNDEPKTPFVLCLRHTDSQVHPGTGKCRFLAEQAPDRERPLGAAKCGAYSSRPMACRVFPTKFNATGELTVIHDVPKRGRADGHPAYTLCPRPWRADEVDPVQAPQDLAVAKFEMDFFRSVAGIWNRTPRPFAVFPDFLRLVYQNRVVTEAAAEPAAAEPAATDRGPTLLPFPTAARRAA